MGRLPRRDFIETAATLGTVVGLGARRRWLPPVADVAIVGGGLSGLVAAAELTGRGAEVVVLEAKTRVGGRTLNQALPGGAVVDAGGQWVGPTQDAVLALAEQLAVPTFKTYTGRAEGTLDDSAAFSVEMLGVVGEFQSSMTTLPIEAPWSAPRAAEWDALTIADWIASRKLGPATIGRLRTAVSATLGGSLDQVSFLCWLSHLRSAGGFRMVEGVEGAARERRLVGGAQRLSLALAERLGPKVLLGSPVGRIIQKADRVEIRTRVAIIEARRVIVAMSPLDASRIEFLPALPADRQELMAQWKLAPGYKAHLVYPTPFWRAAGFNAISVGAAKARLTFDSSPPEGGPGVIVVFGDRAALPRNKSQRQAALTEDLVSTFGSAVLRPTAFFEQDWSEDPWNGGCASPLSPGLLSKVGASLRRPVDRIHWAGTETSERWNGYLDGAVRAGQRAAGEVLAAL
ncbi:MAG: flavin monoamine oxidase family protein [Gemmatimonadales bacterium]